MLSSLLVFALKHRSEMPLMVYNRLNNGRIKVQP